MRVNGERAFELLQKIGFVRVSGSEEELRAAEILAEEVKSIGLDAEIVPFPVEAGEIEEATLEITAPYQKSYPVKGWALSENTPPEGLEAEFVYAEDAIDANLTDVKGKIVLVNSLGRVVFKRLLKAGAAAVIALSGELHEKREEIDIPTPRLNEISRAFGNMPALSIRVPDAFEIVLREASRARVVVRGHSVQRHSHNVVTEIRGTEKPEEIILFGAHYDSVPFSSGVYDNGAGSVTIMELLRWFKENPPRRTVRFAWFGSEEVNLDGSTAYAAAHKNEMQQHLAMINVDVGGAVLGNDNVRIAAKKSAVDYTDYFMKMKGYPIRADQGVSSSDSAPLADQGVPAFNFSRGGASGAAYIHDRHDTLEFLHASVLGRTAEWILDFSETLVNAEVFPIEHGMPEEMTKELDNYFLRKEFEEAKNFKK